MTQSTEATLSTKVISIIADQLKTNMEDLKAGHHLVDDLGADSLDTVELLMELEEKFSVVITDEEAEKLTTVQSVVDYIAERT